MNSSASRQAGLDALFRPRAVAVIGATERPGSVGRAVMENLVQGGFAGPILPVHPGAGSILGLRAYRRIADAPGPVDAAVIQVPAEAVAGVIGECAAAGARAAVVISAGFRECGPAGAAREEAMKAAAEDAGLTLLGPNCLGFLNTGFGLNATFARRVPKPGNLSFLSQSGALGVYALEYAAVNDIGLRLFASLGNKAMTDENDVLEAFGRDPGTKVVLAYLEDFRDPGPFLEQAAALASGPEPKPVILLKAGTGRSGIRAAGSHTGALAERADFLADLCEQYGIVRAATLEEMFETAQCLANQPLPAGPRLAVITNAGGPAILAADEAERRGLSLPEPPPALRAELAPGLPAAAGLGNPFDLLGDADPSRYRFALSRLADRAETDAVLAICTPQRMTDLPGVARALAAEAPRLRAAGKPLVAALARFAAEDDAEAALDAAGIPDYAFPENAARALAQAWRHRRWRERPDGRPLAAPPAGEEADGMVRAARDAGRKSLGPGEAAALLAAFGLDVAPSRLVRIGPPSPEGTGSGGAPEGSGPGDAAAGTRPGAGSAGIPPEAAEFRRELEDAAEILGYPLVAKLEAKGLLHKTDVGGVVTGITDRDALDRAHALLRGRAERAGLRMEGILLQKSVSDGIELLIGAHRHPHFGPLIACGLGGTLVEAMGAPRFRRAPLSPWDAEEMLAGMPGAAVLGPFRGKPARDRAALKACLLAVSRLMLALPGIAELDFNPVFACERGAWIADARILPA